MISSPVPLAAEAAATLGASAREAAMSVSLSERSRQTLVVVGANLTQHVRRFSFDAETLVVAGAHSLRNARCEHLPSVCGVDFAATVAGC